MPVARLRDSSYQICEHNSEGVKSKYHCFEIITSHPLPASPYSPYHSRGRLADAINANNFCHRQVSLCFACKIGGRELRMQFGGGEDIKICLLYHLLCQQSYNSLFKKYLMPSPLEHFSIGYSINPTPVGIIFSVLSVPKHCIGHFFSLYLY